MKKSSGFLAMAAAVLMAAVLGASSARAATYTANWEGGDDNLWNNASQWNPTARYPDNGQPVATDTYDVIFGNNANAATLNQDITIETLTFHGTTISNTGNTLTVNGPIAWENRSANRPQLTGTGTLNALGGVDFNAMGSAGAGNPALRNSWTVNLYDDSVLRGGGWYMLNMGTINIQDEATFEITTISGPTAIGYVDTVGTVNVLGGGTLKRSTNTETTKVDNVVNNQVGGTVDVASGGLWLSQGGTHAGSFTVASGSLLQFSGTHTFNSGAEVDGAGNVTFTGPATFNSGATFAPSGTTTLNGAAVTFAATTNIPGSVTALNNFQLNGDGDVNISGKFNWQLSAGGGGSSLNGAGVLNALGGMDITGYFARTNNKTINLYGNSTFDGTLGGGEHRVRNNATINIQDGATFDIIGNACELGYGTTLGTVNVLSGGTLKRSTATTLNTVNNIVNNQAGGNVQVASGDFHLAQGGTHAAGFTVAAGSLLQFSGTHTFNSGASVGGAGNVTFTGPATFNAGASLAIGGNATVNGTTVSFAEPTTIGGTLTLTGSNFQLNGDGDVTVTGKVYWPLSSGSSLNGTGVINALGGMEITGYFARSNNKTINLYGNSSIDFQFDFYMTNNGTFNIQPAATLELEALGGSNHPNGVIRGTGTVNNQGTFFRAQGEARYVVNTLNNTGTVRVDAGGQFDFTGPVTQLDGATLTGGTWHADGGTLNLPGSNLTTIGADATVILENGGVINRIGASLANVQGTLEVNDMTFTPAATITVDTTGTLTGTGTVAANVVNAGVVSPGESPGIFSVDGDFTQTSTGVLLIDLAGYTQGVEYDLLSVSGVASLGGGLDIVLVDEFEPPYGSTFDVLTASSLSADGFGLVGPNAGLFAWSIVDGTTLQLTSQIPEPTSGLLLALAGLALLKRRCGK